VPDLEEGHIAAMIQSQATEHGGGAGGVQLRWSAKPRPGVWIATVAANKAKTKYHRATGGTPLRALVSLEIVVQGYSRRHRK
jgi:hypothetical protein